MQMMGRETKVLAVAAVVGMQLLEVVVEVEVTQTVCLLTAEEEMEVVPAAPLVVAMAVISQRMVEMEGTILAATLALVAIQMAVRIEGLAVVVADLRLEMITVCYSVLAVAQVVPTRAGVRGFV